VLASFVIVCYNKAVAAFGGIDGMPLNSSSSNKKRCCHATVQLHLSADGFVVVPWYPPTCNQET
jgi:hypothetical protein